MNWYMGLRVKGRCRSTFQIHAAELKQDIFRKGYIWQNRLELIGKDQMKLVLMVRIL